MSRFSRGEVWVVDLGMAAQIRPAAILLRAVRSRLITVVPHTTSVRSSSVEVAVNSAFLKPGI
jgi:mRNA interferase MazF